LVTGIVFWSSPVQAWYDDGGNKIAYSTGIVKGKAIVAQTWAGIEENCGRLDEFETIIINNLMDYELPSAASQYVVDRYSGHVEGMLQEIDKIYAANCNCGKCSYCGATFFGEISAIAYCQLSFALEGLATADNFVPVPMQLCDELDQIMCELMYSAVTRAYIDDAWDDPETTDVNEGECKRYTDMGDVLDPDTGDPMWEPVWHQVRDIQCSFAEP
jgi:hypothetical protein